MIQIGGPQTHEERRQVEEMRSLSKAQAVAGGREVSRKKPRRGSAGFFREIWNKSRPPYLDESWLVIR